MKAISYQACEIWDSQGGVAEDFILLGRYSVWTGKYFDVSKEPTAFIFMIILGLIFSEDAGDIFFETSVTTCQIVRRYILVDFNLQNFLLYWSFYFLFSVVKSRVFLN
jgi:hypothetical protein